MRNGRYYVITGDFKPASGTQLEGLYYATNRFIGPGGTITAGPKGYTIVTEGHIDWSGASNTGTAYAPGTFALGKNSCCPSIL